ncbi:MULTISPECIES: hypothetical protein [Lactobacillus]|uniref:Uncharacterized protein n=1 Tax=Lactobacillus xujianguonis TaxID=2495899 RepID=A0A437SX04_9LACO|nr:MULTISPECIES: hypothetical protein [Lactobacillus]RVU71432.1 hypothetical protein EJK17_01650 [Lactobacillus xujianguonis]RVU72455.1 hypothetical protein EJK20_09840 [Lactobacillus xujianguonis]
MKKLRFSLAAKEKYEELTGAQRTYIDQGLEHLKQDDLTGAEYLVNEELGMEIKFALEGQTVTVLKIGTVAEFNRDQYPEAQQRMLDWNN